MGRMSRFAIQRPPLPHLLAGAGAGLVGILVMFVIQLALRTIAGTPTVAELMGDRIAPLIPYGPFLFLLGFFGGYNQFKQLGIAAAFAGQALAGVLGGVVLASVAHNEPGAAERGGRPGPRTIRIVAGMAAAVWLLMTLLLLPNLGTSYIGLPPGTATFATMLSLAVGLAAYAATSVLAYGWLLPAPARATVASDVDASVPINLGRRRLLVGGAGIVAAVAAGGLLRQLADKTTFSYDGTQYSGPNLDPITPNDRFYSVTKNVVDPRVRADAWRLDVTGHVDRSMTYDLPQVEALASVDQETTLMCISNPIAWGLMSNAVWTGVPMAALLDAAGVQDGAEEVLLHGADGYTDTFSIAKAMDPTTLVAYRMNGEPLPQRHGFPARVIVPGMYGEKNVKWVTSIEVVDRDAKGFYESQGWGPDFEIPNRSRIDADLSQAIRVGTPFLLHGIAFGGNRGVSGVEVSTDGTRTWQPARITYAGTDLTWSFWEYDWTPASGGRAQIAVRMTDGQGDLQTADERGTAPQGATGYHRVTAMVSA